MMVSNFEYFLKFYVKTVHVQTQFYALSNFCLNKANAASLSVTNERTTKSIHQVENGLRSISCCSQPCQSSNVNSVEVYTLEKENGDTAEFLQRLLNTRVSRFL